MVEGFTAAIGQAKPRRTSFEQRTAEGSFRGAEKCRTRCRIAPVAASPALIQPPNAITIVVKLEGTSR
jgi:hypothetical protein